MVRPKLLLIDNYDSFTHNLARYFRELGVDVQVVRNDHISCQQIEALSPDYIVLSPGPCTPNESGVSLNVIEHFAGNIPLLGVCLGHQAIGQVFGANIQVAKHIMHGKTSPIEHNHSPLFCGVPDPFTATRYHSLLVELDSLPDELIATAWCNQFGDTELMAMQHKTMAIFGVQFHPESLLTTNGHKILSNFLKITVHPTIY